MNGALFSSDHGCMPHISLPQTFCCALYAEIVMLCAAAGVFMRQAQGTAELDDANPPTNKILVPCTLPSEDIST